MWLSTDTMMIDITYLYYLYPGVKVGKYSITAGHCFTRTRPSPSICLVSKLRNPQEL